MKTATALTLLTAARQSLAHGTSEFICWALDEVTEDDRDLPLHDIIRSGLHTAETNAQSFTLGNWLSVQADINDIDIRLTGTTWEHIKTQARLAWLDRLIDDLTNSTGNFAPGAPATYLITP